VKKSALHLILLYLTPLLSFSQGSLSVSPTRLILNDKEYTNSVTILNTGKDSAFYEVQFVEFRMTQEGKLEKSTPEDSTLLVASPYLQVYPREIALAPDETQTVMVRYRINNNLKMGEYRSHIYFKVNSRPTKPTENNSQQSGFKITPLIGITIPVILRIGNSSSTAEIANLSCSKQPDSTLWANFDIIRNGNASLYGDAEVFYSPFFGTEYPLGNLKGIAAYTNITVRKVAIRLTQPEGIEFRSGHFIARYTDPINRKTILAEQKIKVTGK
jgi:hypothetical protein